VKNYSTGTLTLTGNVIKFKIDKFKIQNYNLGARSEEQGAREYLAKV